MDTHIQPDPDSNVSRPIHVSLPDDVLDRERGHPEGEAGDVMDAPTASPAERLSTAEVQRPRRRRGVLLGTAACVLLLGVGAAYVFSPYNTAYPVPRMASTLRHLANEAGIGQPPVLAPSAHLAKVNAPPLPPPTTRDSYTPVPRKSEVDEILALRGGAPSGAAARDAAPPRHAAPDVINSGPAEVPGEPGGPAISSNPTTIASQQASLPPKPVVAPSNPVPKPDLTQSIVAGMRDHDDTNSIIASPAQSAPAGSPTTIPAAEPQKLAAAAPLVQPQQQPQPSSATAAPVLQADAVAGGADPRIDGAALLLVRRTAGSWGAAPERCGRVAPAIRLNGAMGTARVGRAARPTATGLGGSSDSGGGESAVLSPPAPAIGRLVAVAPGRFRTSDRRRWRHPRHTRRRCRRRPVPAGGVPESGRGRGQPPSRAGRRAVGR